MKPDYDWWCVAPSNGRRRPPRQESISHCTWPIMNGARAKQNHENCGIRNPLGQIIRPSWVKARG